MDTSVKDLQNSERTMPVKSRKSVPGRINNHVKAYKQSQILKQNQNKEKQKIFSIWFWISGYNEQVVENESEEGTLI